MHHAQIAVRRDDVAGLPGQDPIFDGPLRSPANRDHFRDATKMILYQRTRCFPGARSLSGQRLEVRPTRVPKRLHEVAGSVRIAEQDLLAGDYLSTEAGDEHDMLALTNAIIFVSSQMVTPIVE